MSGYRSQFFLWILVLWQLRTYSFRRVGINLSDNQYYVKTGLIPAPPALATLKNKILNLLFFQNKNIFLSQ
jgi:hypothetical protein